MCDFERRELLNRTKFGLSSSASDLSSSSPLPTGEGQEISLRKDTSYTYAVLAEFEKEYNENNEKALPYITKAISMNPKNISSIL